MVLGKNRFREAKDLDLNSTEQRFDRNQTRESSESCELVKTARRAVSTVHRLLGNPCREGEDSSKGVWRVPPCLRGLFELRIRAHSVRRRIIRLRSSVRGAPPRNTARSARQAPARARGDSECFSLRTPASRSRPYSWSSRFRASVMPSVYRKSTSPASKERCSTA